MFSFLKQRSWHLATTWVLVALQVHLLMVLVLHHHAIPNILPGYSSAKVGHTNPHSHPNEGPETYCTACQILRHSAVRPSLGSPTPRCSIATTFLAACRASKALATQPITLCGRSPPLG
ncbi:MAG TPA: hypothetical protein VMW54_07165 [Terriglobia bacterium]|nr:hypothetical protein [Terriglobia bacterium]